MRGWFDSGEAGRRHKALNVGFEDVGNQLVGKLLGTLTVLDQRRRLAERDKDLVFTDGLQRRER